ncbi:MAG: hypothetical protein HYY35_10325 [Deltaproteobacteria bacterium]|nr:hypothetical protein [Deltaproteobacteria bacterium]
MGWSTIDPVRRRRLLLRALAVVLAGAASESAARPPNRTPTPSATSTPRPTATAQPSPTAAPPGSVSIILTDPAPGATIDSDRYNVRGTFQGPANTGVVVNDRVAYAADGRFALNALPLAAGANAITATATAPDGRSATASVSVTATRKPPDLVLNADAARGLAPLTVTFTYTRTSPWAINKLYLDFDGDGRDDYRTNRAPASVQNTYTQPGLYHPRLTITDIAGTTVRADLAIEVASLDARDALFLSVWDPMNDALVRGDVATALGYLNARAREKYGPIFDDLRSDMPGIVASYSRPQRVSTDPEILEYAINRTIDGVNQIFFVYLLRDADGVWRLDSM